MDLIFYASHAARDHIAETLRSTPDCAHDAGIFLLDSNSRAVVEPGGQSANGVYTAAWAVLIRKMNGNFAQVLFETAGGKAQAVLNSFPETGLHFNSVTRNK